MNIEGINISSTIAPFTTDDKYATHDEQYGKGGYRSVDTISEMNDIPSQRRKEGMLVRVIANNSYYVLKNGVFIKEEFGGSGGGTGSTTLDYIEIDYMRVLDIFNNTPNDSSAIINLIGQDNLNRIFNEDGCPIAFFNFMNEGTYIYTKCYMRQLIGGTAVIVIPIEFINLKFVITNNEGSYIIELNPFLEYDDTLTDTSYNAPKTSTVYDALQNKAGVYKTSLKLGDIENRYNSEDKTVTTAQLNELQNIKNAWINNKVVIINDNTGQEFYYGILQYTISDDSSNVSVSVMDSRGNPKMFTFDGTAVTPEWEVHGIEVKNGNTNNSNVKILTTPGLFNLERESGNEITLNQNDINIIKSLFSNGYKTTQLYYCGEVNYDYGLFPLNVGSQFEKPYADAANDIETIYLNLTTAIGTFIFESLSIGDTNDIYTVGSPVQPVTNYIAAQSIANLNGYVKFTSGLMIQYGYSTTSHKDSKISFPISFINEKYNITFTPKYLSSYGNESMVDIYINTCDKTGFKVIGRMFNETSGIIDVTDAPFNWIAIGRWK